MSRKPLVSSFSVSFRKATMPEDVEEAKKEHREKLHSLVEKYMDDIQQGKTEGIRNAKDLIEVMKMDLLLMGEATDRTEQNNTFDEMRINKMSQYISEDDPAVQEIMEQMLMALNSANDEQDMGSGKAQIEFTQAERAKFDEKDEVDTEE